MNLESLNIHHTIIKYDGFKMLLNLQKLYILSDSNITELDNLTNLKKTSDLCHIPIGLK